MHFSILPIIKIVNTFRFYNYKYAAKWPFQAENKWYIFCISTIFSSKWQIVRNTLQIVGSTLYLTCLYNGTDPNSSKPIRYWQDEGKFVYKNYFHDLGHISNYLSNWSKKKKGFLFFLDFFFLFPIPFDYLSSTGIDYLTLEISVYDNLRSFRQVLD